MVGLTAKGALWCASHVVLLACRAPPMGRKRGWKGRERGRESDYVRLVFRVVCLGWRAWREMSWREMSWREMSWREIISPLSAPGSGLKVERGGLRGEEGGQWHCRRGANATVLTHSTASLTRNPPPYALNPVCTHKLSRLKRDGPSPLIDRARGCIVAGQQRMGRGRTVTTAHTQDWRTTHFQTTHFPRPQDGVS